MAAELDIERTGPGRFRVEIREPDGASTHEVTVPEGYPAELGVDVDDERLVEASVRFLLEREPRSSIMRAFDLPIIARYFPIYPEEIARRLR